MSAAAALPIEPPDTLTALRTRLWPRSPFARYGTALAVVLLLLLFSRLPELRAPLGTDSASRSLAIPIAAARSFEARGMLESGLLQVSAPLPVSVPEGLVPSAPPLFAWGIFGVHRLFGLSFEVAARVVELAFVALAAVAVFSIASRRCGAVGAFVAGAYVALCPLTAELAGERAAGFGCSLAFASFVEAYLRRPRAWCLGGMIVAALAGALADWRCMLDGAVIAAFAAVRLRADVLRPATALSLTSPLWLGAAVLLAMERLCGTAKVLTQDGLWRTAGVRVEPLLEVGADEWIDRVCANLAAGLMPAPLAVGAAGLAWFLVRRPRAALVPGALLAAAVLGSIFGAPAAYRFPEWQLRFAAPIALGAAVAVGSVVLRWRFGAVILASIFVVSVLGGISPHGAEGAASVQALSRAAQRRVAFGEAWATSESDPLATTVSQRPTLSAVHSKERLEEILAGLDAAVRPCRWWITRVSDDTAPLRAELEERLESERDGELVAFDLTRPKGAAAPRVLQAAKPVDFALTPPRSLDFTYTSAPEAVSAVLEIGAEPLRPVAKVTIPVRSTHLEIPQNVVLGDSLYARLVELDAAGRPCAPFRETFVRLRGVKKLRSKVLLLVPLLGFGLALLAMLLDRAYPGAPAPQR